VVFWSGASISILPRRHQHTALFVREKKPVFFRSASLGRGGDPCQPLMLGNTTSKCQLTCVGPVAPISIHDKKKHQHWSSYCPDGHHRAKCRVHILFSPKFLDAGGGGRMMEWPHHHYTWWCCRDIVIENIIPVLCIKLFSSWPTQVWQIPKT
jgi:hypothetical protein